MAIERPEISEIESLHATIEDARRTPGVGRRAVAWCEAATMLELHRASGVEVLRAVAGRCRKMIEAENSDAETKPT